MTLLIAPVMPPDNAVNTATAPTVMTASTTPYSAIVWPSLRRAITRTKLIHSEKVTWIFTSFVAFGASRRVDCFSRTISCGCFLTKSVA